MDYKGYTAKIEFDEDDSIFVGTVIGVRDIITFHAESVKGLKKEFKATMDDYLEHCRQLGKAPDRQYSGKLVLRLSPEEHRKLAREAERKKVSLNDFLVNRLTGNRRA